MLREQTNADRELLKDIKTLCASDREIVLVNLCTADGFPISCSSIDELSNQEDKLAAVSSTLGAMSDSSAKQMHQGQCNITIIEATFGNILFVKANYLGKSCVLTVVAREKMALAAARYKTKMLAQKIARITE